MTGKEHKLRKVVNSGTGLCSYIPETKNIVVSEAPDRSYMLKTGNGKRGSLKMVSELPPAGIIGLGLSVSTILLEMVLGDGPDDFVDVLPGFKLTWPQKYANKGLEFVSSFRRHLRCCSRLKILRVKLIVAYRNLTGFSSVRSPLKRFDLRPMSSHLIKPLSSLAGNPFKGWSGLILSHDDPLPAT